MISCLAAMIFFILLLLLAKNIGGVSVPEQLFAYDRVSGDLQFFGETLYLPNDIVNAVIDYPKKSALFTLELLPKTASTALQRLFSVFAESLSALFELFAGALLEFLRLGV